MLLIIEILFVCIIFFILCYFNTGSDYKNIKSFSSYPDEIQSMVLKNPELKSKVKIISPIISFLLNILFFSIIFFILAIFIKKDKFIVNFINILILGQSLNAFDFFVIDMLWWRSSKRIRFSGTENEDKLYQSKKKHFLSFLKGIFLFIIVALIDAFILSFLQL